MPCVTSLIRMRRADVHPARLAAVLLFTWTFGVLGTAPAAASCATDSPAPSPNAFVGTVIATSEAGRVAEVVLDDGATVIVEGTEDTSWFSSSRSSVDRRYALGGRYEFHPVNDASPYADNSCTATRQISGPPLSAFPDEPLDEQRLPGWLPVDEQAGPLGYLLFFSPVAVAVLVVLVVARRVARRRRTGVPGRTLGHA